jgi:hypothetical protein
MFDKVFISYASEDFLFAEQLFNYLAYHNFIPWLDKKSLLPGQNWDYEIKKALREAHYIILLLSENSVQKRGYVQREFKMVLTFCEEKLDDDIYLVPVKINECNVPVSLSKYQWINFNDDNALFNVVTGLNVQRKKFIQEENKRIAAHQTFPYQTIEIRKSYGSYITADIRISYFQFTGNDNESIAEINAIIKGQAYLDLVQTRQSFLYNSQDDPVDWPIHARQWSYETQTKPELITSKLVTFTTFDYTYMGGAHGSYVLSGASYLLSPLRKMELIHLIDYIEHKKCLSFLSKFCIIRLREIEREFYGPLEGEGEMFATMVDKRIVSPKWDTFRYHYFSKNGLEIIFNTGSIAGYAFGQHIVSIPFETLKSNLSNTKMLEEIQEAANI